MTRGKGILIIFEFLVLVSLCSVIAVLQEFTIFSDNNFEGDVVTFRSHQEDLTPWFHFFDKAKSYCSTGAWTTHYGPYFSAEGGGIMHVITQGDCDENVRCFNSPNLYRIQSLRYSGAHDTDLPGISFYNDSFFYGEEFFVNGSSASAIPFRPNSFASTGWSNWTFYEGLNFKGNARCVWSHSKLHREGSFSGEVQSVMRGCNPAVAAADDFFVDTVHDWHNKDNPNNVNHNNPHHHHHHHNNYPLQPPHPYPPDGFVYNGNGNGHYPDSYHPDYPYSRIVASKSKTSPNNNNNNRASGKIIKLQPQPVSQRNPFLKNRQ